MKRSAYLFFLAMSLGVNAQQVQPDYAELLRVSDTLSLATNMVVEIQGQSVYGVRESFSPVLSDLRAINSAILRHIHNPALQPREYEPLVLRYRFSFAPDVNTDVIKLNGVLDTAKQLVLAAKSNDLQLREQNVQISYDGLLADIVAVQSALVEAKGKLGRAYRDVSNVASFQEGGVD